VRTLDFPRGDLTDDELAPAAQENLFDLFRAVTRLPRGELDETAEVSRHRAFPHGPMFWGVWNVRAGAGRAEQIVDESIEWLRRRRAPSAFFWCGPGADPPGYRAALVARGLDPWELEAPIMACELAELDWGALDRAPVELRVERARSADEVEAWAAAFVAAYEIPPWAGKAWIDATLAFPPEEAPWELYLGLLGGEPVATNMLMPGAGVAGVLGVGVVPGARGRGIGAAITLAGYRDALQLGYRYGVLFTTPEGEPVYRRLGLRHRGAAISRYLWRADGDASRR